MIITSSWIDGLEAEAPDPDGEDGWYVGTVRTKDGCINVWIQNKDGEGAEISMVEFDKMIEDAIDRKLVEVL